MTDDTMQKNEKPQEAEEKSENGDYLIKDDVKQPVESQEKKKSSFD